MTATGTFVAQGLGDGTAKWTLYAHTVVLRNHANLHPESMLARLGTGFSDELASWLSGEPLLRQAA